MGHTWKGRLRGAADPGFLVSTGTPEFTTAPIDLQEPIGRFQHVGSLVARIVNRAASLSGRPLPFPMSVP